MPFTSTAERRPHHPRPRVAEPSPHPPLDALRAPTDPPLPELLDLFARQVRERPAAIAVVAADRVLTYAALDEASSRLACWLQARVGPEVRERLIALCVGPSAGRVVALLAILKAGGAYVPLDPHAPAARNRLILADAGADFVLTDDGTHGGMEEVAAGAERPVAAWNLDALSAEIAATPPTPRVVPEAALAYVNYTSGSTGRPKGVVVGRAGVVGLVHRTNYVAITPDDTLAHLASVAFDAATFEIWGALLNGARVVVAEPGTATDPQAFARLLADHRVSIVFLTTALFNQHAALVPSALAGLRYLLFGGEAASSRTVRALFRAGKVPRHLYNVYGPTEATTFATFHPIVACPAEDAPIPIGLPITGTIGHVVDAQLREVGPGEEGELLLGGEGLARGYLNLPELTAARFVESPFRPGERLYRTGDRVSIREDGAIVFVGRIDNQVKVRGFRIELDEIDLALDAHPDIGQALTQAEDDGRDGKRLVAWLRVRPGAPRPTVAGLRAHLLSRLPAYMVPAVFRVVDRPFPLSMTGKVDRGALAALPSARLVDDGGTVAPRSALEAELREVWARHLGSPAETVCVERDFFELGGQSLTAVAILAEVRAARGVDVTMADLLAAPTVAGLARAVAAARRASIALPRTTVVGDLSWSQEQIWLHQQLHPDAPLYNEPLDVVLPEVVDADALRAALGTLVARHEALRARFGWDGVRPRVRITDPEPVTLVAHDLRGRDDREALATALATDCARRPFDLADEPLLRFVLVRLEDARSTLYVIGHHLVIDGVGMFRVFLPELEAAYRAHLRGEEPVLPPLPFAWRDWVAWQRGGDPAVRFAEGLAWWSRALDGLVPLPLPTDRPDPIGEPSWAGAREVLTIGPALTAAVRAVARRSGASVFELLFGAFCALLHDWCGADDLAVGSVFSGRTLPGLERHVCDALNTTLLRVRVPREGRFVDLLAAASRASRDALAHADVPFQLVHRHALRGAAGADPFRVAFVLEPGAAASGWEMNQLAVHTGAAKFDLTMELDARGDHVVGRVEYRTDVFRQDTIRALIERYLRILARVTAVPETSLSELSTAPPHPCPLPRCGGEGERSLTPHAGSPEAERLLRGVWSEVLDLREVPADQGFFELGGDSIAAIRVAALASERGLPLTMRDVLTHRTIRALAARSVPEIALGDGTLVPLRTEGEGIPLFLIHPAGGSSLCYRALADALPRPVYGLDCVGGYDGRSVDDLAATYAAAIRAARPSGPILVGGWSLGGILAHEVAVRLLAEGREVTAVVHVDSRPVTQARQAAYLHKMCSEPAALLALLTRHLAQIAGRDLPITWEALAAVPPEQADAWFLDALATFAPFGTAPTRAFVRRFLGDFRAANGMVLAHKHRACDAPAILLRATEVSAPHEDFVPLEEPGADPTHGWDRHYGRPVRVLNVPGNHETLVFAPHVGALAAALEAALGEVG